MVLQPTANYRNRNNLRQVMFNSGDARLSVSRDTLARVNPEFASEHHWQVLPSDLQALSTLLNQHSDYVVADEISAGFLLGQRQQGEVYQLAFTMSRACCSWRRSQLLPR